MEKQLKQDYTCRICGQSFDSASDLDNHTARMHPGADQGNDETSGEGDAEL